MEKLRATIWNMIVEEEGGQAMVEFAILCLPQYILIAGIIQLCLINMAHLVVNHAAFKAARVALVADEFDNPADATTKVEQTAYAICATIAGNEGVNGGTPISFSGGSGTTTLQRAPAAEFKTKVHIVIEADRRALQVTVEHDYELIMPFVRRMFSQTNIGGAPHHKVIESYVMPIPWTPRR